jgi:Pyruvate/2-oxoacid:ferredoxin oxidoreductase delta subunit
MPAKYVIHSTPAKSRVRPVGKLGIVDWREDCSSCHNCVKRACVYGLYRDEADTLRNELGYLDYIYQCKGCLSCVQNCTKNILTRVVNPEFRRLGDSYYKPDIILSTWFQSESGRIPVSGSGYGGPFSGPGFDSMWTDMSEIVRPTRDGIHGREYINTSVDIGRKLPHLAFADGQLACDPPPLMEIPMPVMFDVIPEHWCRGAVTAAVAAAAAEIGTLAVLRDRDIQPGFVVDRTRVVPLLEVDRATRSARASDPADRRSPLVMIPDGPDIMAVQAAVKREHGNPIVAIRVQATPTVAQRVVELTRGGAEVIHLLFDSHGRELADKPRHVRDVLRDVHGTLVKQGIRDEITIIASGGIALPEHVAKAIICWADLVAIDIPLVLALECRLCGECERGELCQIALEEIEPGYGAHRIVNLLAAWHQQLIEVLGAMGIREVRRLRGETGRAMFFEDLERDAFGRLFGKRKAS